MSARAEEVLWYATPLAVTLLLHVALLGAFALRFDQPRTTVAQITKPVAIQASLVSADSLKPKPKPIQTPKPKPIEKTPEPKNRTEPEKPKPQPVETRATEPSPVTEPPAESTDAKLDLSEEVLADLEAAIAAEQLSQEGDAGSLRDTVAAIIQLTVVNRWTRPPSARNGMRAVLEISLVPTGDVVGVSVLESSGNLAFDRSAMNAVEKAARFPEIKQLDRTEFEETFRQFQLIFRPEDLRY